MVLQMEIAHQKKISLLKYTDGFYSVGECELLKKYFCRSRRRWLWNLHQASVKGWQIKAVGKFIAKMIGISRSLSNADGYSPSVKPSSIIFKYVFKKLFRINNIKLYKLIVKKLIVQIKFLLNIKKS